MHSVSVFGRYSLLLAAILFQLVGCATSSSNGNKKIDYGAAVVPPLEVPPDLARPANNDTMAPVQVAKPKEPGLLPALQGVRQERAGGQRWLVVDQPPDKVWLALHAFLEQMNLTIASENPMTGLIETDWAENKAYVHGDTINRAIAKVLPGLVSPGIKDRYRIRLERGEQTGTSEIYLTHLRLSLEEVPHAIGEVSKNVWQSRSGEPELEAEMLRLLMLRFGVPGQKAEAVLAQSGPVHARLVKEGETNRLLLEDEPQRAWRRVGLALDRMSVVVENRDRARASYTVRYNEPSKEGPGIFGKMFEKVGEARSAEFLISVIQTGNGSEVRVSPGDSATKAGAQQILTWLHEQLK